MDTVLSRLQRALSGRYVVEQELGRGGMAVVYLGRDLRLERRVAIKVFDRTDDSAAGTERFLREIRVAAQLQHPNILPVFESGDAEGLVFYVMPYVAGASLRERLEREGALPLSDAVRIAREVAEALDHAHRAGIVHRDVKPDNIMLADGVAVVADFGIARAIEEGGPGKITETGLALGTPLYMSPEQAAASDRLDGRTDIYALGCVLYEMVAGSPPFQGNSGQAVMARHATDKVPPLSTVRQVPAGLESAIGTALAKLPADRWASGKAFADALSIALPAPGPVAKPSRSRAAVLTATVVLVLVGAWLGWRGLRSTNVAAAEAPVTSVAVLPVRAVGDTGLLKYADGMTEAIINGLLRLEGLKVPGSGRTLAYRERQSDVRAVGRELGVETVLAGTLQEFGGRLRLSVQLVGVRDGLVQWTSTYDGALANLFAMQDSVTVSLVDRLRVRLAPTKRASLVRGTLTRDTVAYRLLLEARRVREPISKENTERAIALLRNALARDSSFADAWLALGNTLDTYKGYSSENHRELDAEIRLATNRAADIDSLNGDAIAQRGWNKLFFDWDIPGAERDLHRAASIAPGSGSVLSAYADLLTYMQKPDSALAYARRSFAIDSFAGGAASAWAAHLAAGNADSAFVWNERAIALNPGCWPCELGRAEYYREVGRKAEADSAIAAFLRGGGDLAQAVGNAAEYFGRAGDRAAVLRMEKRLAAITRERPFGANTARAQVRLALGDREGALAAIDAAEKERERLLPMAILLGLEPLRGNPRFESLRAKFYGGRPPPYSKAHESRPPAR